MAMTKRKSTKLANTNQWRNNSLSTDGGRPSGNQKLTGKKCLTIKLILEKLTQNDLQILV